MILISAIVVLFKPGSEMHQNIKTYLDRIACLYVVDNSPTPSSILPSLLREENVKLLSTSKNIGLAEAYNLGLSHAKQDGYRWLMTMDQDSSFETLQLERYFKNFAKTNKDNLGLYTLLHNPKFLSEKEDERIMIAMSSASIANVDAALKYGAFNTKLFIDEVDHEFCLRIQHKGYFVVQNKKVYVKHFLGEKNKEGQKKYSATRLYYMVRNHLYVKKRYQNLYPDYFTERSKYIRNFIFGQLVHHRHKLRRSVMVLVAFRDYYFKRMGKRYEF